MAIHERRQQFGTDQGRITLLTFRDGLAAQAGHDLTIDAVRWTGELVTAENDMPASLEVSVDLGALVVRNGTGGVRPLTDRDKREIAVNARKVLTADRFPDARFTATGFDAGPDADGGTIAGMLTLAGQTRPQKLAVTQTAPGRYRATTTIRQTNYGIKPYSAFLGSLKVADAVDVEVEIDLSGSADHETGS